MKKIILIFWMFVMLLLGCSKDDDNPAPITITIEDFTITIDENPEQEAVLDTISASTNRGTIAFSLSDQNPEGAMVIDSITGVLTVADILLFDYEVNPTLTATIVATNDKVREQATVTITLTDVDETPITISIEELTITIDENPEQGAILDTIRASTNRGTIAFSLSDQNPEGAMVIDSITGVLSVANATLFNYEVNPGLTAKVIATNEDVTEEAMVTVTLTDVDEVPITISIEELTITIDENPEQGATLDTISASTNRGAVVFSLSDQNPEGAMVIDSITGVLKVNDALLFDYETSPTLTTTVVATNENVTEEAIVTVTLADVDETPITITIEDFVVSIDENPMQGQSLGTIVASTNRGNLTFSLTNENPQGAINIDTSTGELMVADAAVFDYQVNPILTATIIATNEDVTEEAMVTVTLIEKPEDWRQIGMDIERDVASDELVTSISLSKDGLVVAIGASASNGNTGHVRIYQNQAGSWVKVGGDIIGEAPVDVSGISVSLNADGSVLAIGATNNDGNGNLSGHARVFKNQGGNWVQIGADINGESSGNLSGQSVSLSDDGSIVAIGATLNSDNGLYAGHVRVYKNQAGSWVKIGADIDGEAINDYAGQSVSLSADGSVIAIGSPRFNQVNGPTPGRVRVYRNQSGNWVKIGTDIVGQATADRFGATVSLSANGSVVAIGAPSSSSTTNTGYVKMYRNMGSSWSQIGSDISGEGPGARLGESVSLSADGSIVIVGTSTGNGYIGRVKVYRDEGSNWTQLGSDINANVRRQPISVGISANGSIVAVGGDWSDQNGDSSRHVRVFKYE